MEKEMKQQPRIENCYNCIITTGDNSGVSIEFTIVDRLIATVEALTNEIKQLKDEVHRINNE